MSGRGPRGASGAFLRPALALALVAIGIVTVCFQAYASDEVADTGARRDLRSVLAERVLRVSMTRFDVPPFHFVQADGTVAGPEADLARQIAATLGVQLVLVAEAETFDAVVHDVANGRADIGISKLSRTYYRLKQVRFSEPYITLRHALLYNRLAIGSLSEGRSPAQALRDFRGRLGAVRGSAYVDFAHRKDRKSVV
jgi:polar amino acid transport system substrate-binding protein